MDDLNLELAVFYSMHIAQHWSCKFRKLHSAVEQRVAECCGYAEHAGRMW